MRYYSEDIRYLSAHCPYLTLTRRNGVIQFLQRQAEAAEECLVTLRAYPEVRIDALEFFYTCLRSLGALDESFFTALINDHSWRGVVWGAWIAILEPRPEFARHLRALGPLHVANQWLVDAAIAVVEGRPPLPEHSDYTVLAARCRRSLEGVTRPTTRLRPEPREADRPQVHREIEQIRSVYAEQGTESALRCLPGTLAGYYAQDYKRWIKSGAPPPPRKLEIGTKGSSDSSTLKPGSGRR